MLLLLAIAEILALPVLARAQLLADSAGSSSAAVLPSLGTTQQPDLIYTRPTQKIKLRNYFFDAFGLYPMAAAALAAGINQVSNDTPEWQQGAGGYGKRFASDSGIAAVSHHDALRAGRPSGKTRCITAVSAGACFRG